MKNCKISSQKVRKCMEEMLVNGKDMFEIDNQKQSIKEYLHQFVERFTNYMCINWIFM